MSYSGYVKAAGDIRILRPLGSALALALLLRLAR